MLMTAIVVFLALLVLILLGVILGQAAKLRFHLVLAELNETLIESDDPVVFGRVLLAGMAKAVRAKSGLIYGGKQGLTGLKLRGAHGLDQKELGEAATDPAFREWVDKAGGEEVPGLREAKLKTNGFLRGYSDALAVKLNHGGKLVGLVFLLRARGRFSRRDRRLIGEFAPRAAAALDKAETIHENKGAADENARLYLNLSKLYRLATVDNLTGLPNRGHMQQRLREEIKKAWRFKHDLSVLILDIDLFCQVNEFYGQEVGDEVLREIARIIRQAARDYDIVGRFGGEEILVILPQTGAEGAIALAERLRQETGNHSFPEGVRLTCSVGVASLSPAELAPPGGKRPGGEALQGTMENLLNRAEAALFEAKELGRNRIQVAAEGERE